MERVAALALYRFIRLSSFVLPLFLLSTSQWLCGQDIPGTIAPNATHDSPSLPERLPEVRALAPLPTAVPTGRKSIGLVLEGGGALGLAHIGVLLWLEENHIPVDRIAGTSMGALIGGLYATGKSPQELRKLATNDLFSSIFSLQTPYDQIGYRRRQDRRDLPQGVTLGLKNGIGFRNAILSDSELNALLREQFGGNISIDGDFNRLPIPFRCVATDLNTLEPVVFRGGSMSEAVRASISIPGVFAPVHYRDHYLVDGGLTNNLPTDITRTELQADIVIAVHLEAAPLGEADMDSILGIVSRAMSAGIAKTERLGIARADLVVRAQTEGYTTADYLKAHELIEKGYQAAERQRDHLLALRLSEADWEVYLRGREARRTPPPGRLLAIRLEGGSEPLRRDAGNALAKLKDKPFEANTITRAFRSVEGSGAHEVSFGIFPPQIREPASGTARESGTGLLVHLGDVRNGPPYLIIGAEIAASTSNVTRNTIDFRFIDQDLGGYGSELRVNGGFGFLTQGRIEYYRPVASGFFVQPHLDIMRHPVYLWEQQRRIAERFEQNAGGGVDFGKTFNRRSQLAAEWHAESVRWQLVSGVDGRRNITGTAQTGALHFTYDSALTGAVSPQGMRLDASIGSLFDATSSQTAPMAQLAISKTQMLHEKNVLGIRVGVENFFRHGVADPFRFTLGGPLRLSASSIDEYRGTDNYLIRGGYLRRIAALPSGLGQGLYLTGAYEAGEIWSPENRAVLRQDVVGGVVASTPFGVITLAGSAGDAGRRKVFFTLGKLF